MAAILQISACFMLLLLPCSTAPCSSTRQQCEKDLYSASLNGELEKVKEALESQVDPNVHNVNDRNFTPLMAAAQNGHVKVVQILIDYSANITATRPSTGYTPLMLAAIANKAEVVRVLLRACADVNVRNIYGYTPLMAAAQKGHVSVIQALHEFNVNLELTDPVAEAAALYQSVQFNQTSAARRLLGAGANVNVRSNGGITPLIKAVKEGYYGVVRVLLMVPDIKVDLVQPSRNWTALHYAAMYQHKDTPAIVHLLLKKGADKTKQTKNNFTPAALARVKGNDVVQKIIEDYK